MADKSEEQSCKGKTKKSCCKNKTVRIQLKDDQKQYTTTNYEIVAPFAVAILPEYGFVVANSIVACEQPTLYKRPPPNIILSKNILFCVFRI